MALAWHNAHCLHWIWQALKAKAAVHGSLSLLSFQAQSLARPAESEITQTFLTGIGHASLDFYSQETIIGGQLVYLAVILVAVTHASC